uniref:Phosphatidylinositol 4-kinase type 2 n=1 Tax=Setaria digitata TaxID=48799 RepID=A0A915PF67_9BILA
MLLQKGFRKVDSHPEMVVTTEDYSEQLCTIPINIYPNVKQEQKNTTDQSDFSYTGVTSRSEENYTIPEKEAKRFLNDNAQESSQSISLPSTITHPDPGWQHRVCAYVASSQQEILNDDDFNQNLKRALEAIKAGIQPVRIPAGSSGSYFVRDMNYQNIAVFKPKDEEPFAPQNPKWPKYFQRMLCFCCFGRACLIPNNGYISETAASLVDEKLQLHIVPKTRIVKLASPAFYYKGRWRKDKELKGKDGSYQLFLNGYVSASAIVPQWSKGGEICPLTAIEVERFKYEPGKILELAAIDNGLAFPVKHPETSSRLRQFPFAWAQLSWANHPWNEELRTCLLQLLTPRFVQSLCDDIATLFKYDRDVNRFLKYSQLRVLRGQIWNLRLALIMKEPPAEMVKRPLVLVSRRYRRHPPNDDWNRAFRVKPADFGNRACC